MGQRNLPFHIFLVAPVGQNSFLSSVPGPSDHARPSQSSAQSAALETSNNKNERRKMVMTCTREEVGEMFELQLARAGDSRSVPEHRRRSNHFLRHLVPLLHQRHLFRPHQIGQQLSHLLVREILQ